MNLNFSGAIIDISETVTDISCDEDMPSLSINQVKLGSQH